MVQVRALESQIQAKAEKSEAAKTAPAASPAPVAEAKPAKEAPVSEVKPEADKAPTGEAKAPPADGSDAGKDAKSEDAAAPDNGEGDPTAKPPKKKGNFKKRIAEITRERHAERLRAEAAEAELSYYRQQAAQGQPQPPQQRTQANTDGKPTLEQYGYDQDAYEEARDKWVIAKAEQSFVQRQQQADQQRKQQERISTFKGRIAEFEKEVPGGWAETVSAPITYTPPMVETIANSEIGPRIGHYLSQNLDEAHQITQLSPFAQAAALVRIEQKLLAARAAAPTPSAKPAQNTVSKAPAPPPVIPTGSPASTPVEAWGVEDHIAAVQAKRRAKLGA